jgi:hypothetical protein
LASSSNTESQTGKIRLDLTIRRSSPELEGHDAPEAVGTFGEIVLKVGEAMELDASTLFKGADLRFTIGGAGAEINRETGIITLAKDVLSEPEQITVTASNSGGAAHISFLLTMIAGGMSEHHSSPKLIVAPSLSGSGLVGTELSIVSGVWSGDPAPEFSFQWLRNDQDIDGAQDAEYRITALDDRAMLGCLVTVSNSRGEVSQRTPSVRVTCPAPVALVDLVEEVFDLETGPQILTVAKHFTGENLTFAVTGRGASVARDTGDLAISTAEALSGEEIVITAENSGGSASMTLIVTVEDEGSDDEGLSTNDIAAHEDHVSFAGPNLVQVIIYDNDIAASDQLEVKDAGKRRWSPDPNDRLGGEGSFAGVSGNFSGDANISAPQLFFPWPKATKTEYSGVFAVTDGGAANRSAADFPGNWTVKVNGSAKPVANVFRKTVPVLTDMVAPRTYDNRRRHLVTLVLADDLPAGARVEVRPSSGDPLYAIYDGKPVSEAIHVCQVGYPQAGPKKAYVGLWLGADRKGIHGTTDALLGTNTAWRLVGTEDGKQVANGKLALAKPLEESHQANLNYNGCDIYEADFSAWTKPGNYRVEIEGVGSSFTFAIGDQPYAEAFRLAARWYFHQRSGCAIESSYGEGRRRPRNDHPEDGIVIHQTDVLLGRHSEGFVGGSHIFERLKDAARSTPVPANTIAAEPSADLVPNDVFDNTNAWRERDASFQLTAGGLEIAAAPGYRSATLDLLEKTSSPETYLLRIHVATLEGNVRVKLNRGTEQSLSTLSAGWNTIEISGAENQGLFLDAMSNASASIDAISMQSKAAPEDVVIDAPGNAALPGVQTAWGGWHDAGDWDRRIQHMGVVFTMAQMIELLPSLRGIDLNIPESGLTFADARVRARKNSKDKGDGKTILPDLIHEALWGISLWRRTQKADGGIIGGVEYSLDGIAGSVSWNHVQETYAYAPEEWSAYQFVTGAAKLGHVIKTVCGDAALGSELISEASRAWAWAESVLGSGIDAYNTFDNISIATARITAAAVLYRATGNEGARTVFEANNAFKPVAGLPVPKAGDALGTRRGDYVLEAWEYVRAGREGRPVNKAISDAIVSWSDHSFSSDTRIGSDYGLQSTGLYPWGAGWMRFGPGSNWRCGRLSLDVLAKGKITDEVAKAAVEGMWFALGCNPSNVSLIQGLGARPFGDPLLVDGIDGPVPGNPSFGPAAGNLRYFEISSVGDSIYPKEQAAWPRYAAIFESRRAVVCSEHGMKSNALEWLFACGFVAEALNSR